MKQEHFTSNEADEFFLDEGCFILEISNQEDHKFSIARARLAPGKKTELHTLKKTDEAYYILSGTGYVYQDGSYARSVQKGDVVYYTSGAIQSIMNPSKKEDLLFLCVCSPGFKPDCYQKVD